MCTMALQVPQHFRDPLLKLRRTRKDLRSCQWPKRQRLWVVRSVRRSDCQQLLRFRIESQLEVAQLTVSASQPGSLMSFMNLQLRPKPTLKLLSFLSVCTKQQSKLKYSHSSLMSIPLQVALVHVGFAEILGPSELCSDFPSILGGILVKQGDFANGQGCNPHRSCA